MIFIILYSALSQAEYRVYQYNVSQKQQNPLDQNSHLVTSTLDPISYESYHGGDLLRVDLLRSWICKGHTGRFKAPCPPPLSKAQKNDPQEVGP